MIHWYTKLNFGTKSKWPYNEGGLIMKVVLKGSKIEGLLYIFSMMHTHPN